MCYDVAWINLSALYQLVHIGHIVNNGSLSGTDINVALHNIPKWKAVISAAINTCQLDCSCFANSLCCNNNRAERSSVQLHATGEKFEIIHLAVHANGVYDNVGSALSYFF
ncbi:hypothetical protein D3C78_1570750 [compost metagenome]